MRLVETAIYATNLDAMEAFYADVVGLQRHSSSATHCFFRLSQSMLLIFDPNDTEHQSSRVNGSLIPPHAARGASHIAFAATDAELDTWRERLHEMHVEIESEVTWPNGARSIYVRDPAGHCVEFVTPRLWGLA